MGSAIRLATTEGNSLLVWGQLAHSQGRISCTLKFTRMKVDVRVYFNVATGHQLNALGAFEASMPTHRLVVKVIFH